MSLVAPMAEWRPLPRPMSTTPLQYRIVNVHTMVGSLEGSESHFSHSGNPYSHFGLGKLGLDELWQWQDLRYRAASDLDGNPFSISIETEDDGPNKPIPPWTEAQCDALEQLIAWCCVAFAIPAVLEGDSLPTPHGLSVHRRGIDSYPELYAPGWRQPNGIYYSNSRGKTCPTDVRIQQLQDRIVPGVQRLIGEDEMTEADWDRFSRIVHDQVVAVVLRSDEGNAQAKDDPWKHEIEFSDGSKHSAHTVLRDTRTIARRAEQAVEAMQDDVDAIKDAVVPPE